MNGDPIKQALRDFVATSNSGKYKTEDELLSKFPELKGYDRAVLRDFVATSNSGKYKTEDELLSKFPEFGGAPVKKKESTAPVGVAGAALSAATQKPIGEKPAQALSPQPPTSQQGVPSTSRLTSVSGVGTGSKDLGVTAGAINLMPKTPGQFVAKSVDTGQKYEAPKTLAEKALAPQGPQGVRINALKAYNTQKEEVKRQIDENQDLKNLQQQKTFLEGRLNEIASEKLKRGEQTFDDDPEYADLQNRLSELNDRIGFEKLSAEDQLKIKTIPELVSYMQTGGNRIIQGFTSILKGTAVNLSSDNDVNEVISWVLMPGAKAAWELFKPENAQPKDNPLYQLGNIIDDWRERHHHVNPLVVDKFSYQLTTALMGDLPMYGLAGTLGGPAAVSFLGAMDNGVSEYEAAKQKVFDANYLTRDEYIDKYGGDNYETRSSAGNAYNELKGQDPEEVASKMFIISAGIGTLEGLPFLGLFNKIDKKTGGAFSKYLKQRGIPDAIEILEKSPAAPFIKGAEEWAQEGFAQILTNASANSIYDETRGVLEGVGDASAIGFTMGFTLKSIGMMTNALVERRASADEVARREIDRSLALVREYERRLLNNEPVASPKTLEQKRKVDEIDNKLAEGKDLNETQISALKEVKKKAEAEYDRMLSEDMDRLGNEGKVIELQQKAEAVKDVAPEEAANFLAEAERLKAEMPVAPEAVAPTEAAPEGEGGAAGMAMVRSINELKAEVELMKQGKETPEKAAKIAEFEKEIAEQESLGIDPDKGRVVPAELAPETMPQAAPSAPSPEKVGGETTPRPELANVKSTTVAFDTLQPNMPEGSPERIAFANKISALEDLAKYTKEEYKRRLNVVTQSDVHELISEKYHKAKADGSNPELVKAVEELFAAPQTAPSAEVITQAAPSVPSPEAGSVVGGDGLDYVRNKFSESESGGKQLSDKESKILNKEVDRLIERAEKENGVKRNELKQATWKTNDGYTITEFFENGSGGTRIITPKGEEINLFDNKYKSQSGQKISYFPKAHKAVVTTQAAPSLPSPEAQQTAEVNRQAVRVFEEISPLLDARKGADVKNKRDINKAISEKIKSNPKADFIYTNWNKLKKQLKFEHEGNCP